MALCLFNAINTLEKNNGKEEKVMERNIDTNKQTNKHTYITNTEITLTYKN